MCLCNYSQYHCRIHYLAVVSVDTSSETLWTNTFYLSTLSFTKINNTLQMADDRNVSKKHWRNDTIQYEALAE